MEFNFPLINLLLLITAAFIAGLFFISGYISLKENEKRASTIFLVAGLFIILVYGLVCYTNFEFIKWVLFVLPYLVGLDILIPSFNKKSESPSLGKKRIDERDVMFSRRLLKEGTDNYNKYYSRFPDRKIVDDNFRSKPGLLSEDSKFYNVLSFAAANASFKSVESLVTEIDGPFENKQTEVSPEKLTSFVKNWTKHLGALDVGITPLNDYHLYSYRGRNHNYGD